MQKKECVAMLLAGGQGSRLGALTRKIAKPAVAFGGKYRIIDFGLSNCANSNIDTVGVLTQYKPQILNAYLGNGAAWDLDSSEGGLQVLQPYATETGGRWYDGTADAIYRNIDFIDRFNPQYVVILSGDHIYKMNYNDMLNAHKAAGAALTVSVMEVPWEEAPRFGIMSVDENMLITKFSEKPKEPDSNLASMGIYVFTWSILRAALVQDHTDHESEHDFGKNIIPMLLAQGEKLLAYTFSGYWMDVGTVESYYNAQMALLEDEPEFDIFSDKIKMFSNSNVSPPQYLGPNAVIDRSILCNGDEIYGTVKNSILSPDVYVAENAVVEDSIILPGARIEKGARVIKAIVGEETVICENACFCGGNEQNKIALIGNNDRFESA